MVPGRFAVVAVHISNRELKSCLGCGGVWRGYLWLLFVASCLCAACTCRAEEVLV